MIKIRDLISYAFLIMMFISMLLFIEEVYSSDLQDCDIRVAVFVIGNYDRVNKIRAELRQPKIENLPALYEASDKVKELLDKVFVNGERICVDVYKDSEAKPQYWIGGENNKISNYDLVFFMGHGSPDTLYFAVPYIDSYGQEVYTILLSSGEVYTGSRVKWLLLYSCNVLMSYSNENNRKALAESIFGYDFSNIHSLENVYLHGVLGFSNYVYVELKGDNVARYFIEDYVCSIRGGVYLGGECIDLGMPASLVKTWFIASKNNIIETQKKWIKYDLHSKIKDPKPTAIYIKIVVKNGEKIIDIYDPIDDTLIDMKTSPSDFYKKYINKPDLSITVIFTYRTGSYLFLTPTHSTGGFKLWKPPLIDLFPV